MTRRPFTIPSASPAVNGYGCRPAGSNVKKTAGVYDFAWLDAIVDNLLRRGIQPWFSAGFGHPIHTPVPAYEEQFRQSGNFPANGMVRGYVGEVPLYHGPRAMAAWKNYLAAMAEHFAGRVRHYEIWNEPDLHVFWRHLGRPVYADLKEELRRIRDCGKIMWIS